MIRYQQRGGADGGPLGQLSPWLSAILRARGISTPEKAEAYLHPSLDRLEDPWRMQDMDKAAEILRRAAREGQTVAVYGDYDVDGVCATAIMLETLRDLGITAIYHLPSRHQEGYGLNEGAVRALAKQAQVLLTVDCGITNLAEVRLARLLGMTVIVTDHHQLGEELPKADAVLNPLLGDYPFRKLCGAGVALKITQALQGMEAVRKRVDIAALATVADIVPLTEENRIIVRAGLEAMAATGRPGLRALMDASAVPVPVNAGHVGFRLAPRLNAGGRLEDASQGVELLLTRDEAQAADLAAHLEQSNRQRQALEQDIVRQAEGLLAEQMDFRDDRLIIVARKGWNSGVIGLAAGRLCEKYHYPAIVLSISEEKDEAVGSCRSIQGVNIHAALTSCRDLFLRFGGHEMAAGLTLRPSLIPELRRRLNLYILENCDPACYVPVKEYDLELPLSRVDLALVDALSALQPTGYCNPGAVFLTRGAYVQEARAVGSAMNHLKLTLSQENTVRGGIAFGMGELARQGLEQVDLLYEPDRNEFRGEVSAQLQIKSLRPAAGTVNVPKEDIFLSALLQELGEPAENHREIRLPVLPKPDLIRKLRQPQGTLALCRHPALAAALVRETGADLAAGTVADPRCFSTVLCAPDLSRLTDGWHHVVLADGCLYPEEAGRLNRLCPRAELSALAPNPELKAWLRAAAPDDAQLRRLYLRLREALPLSLPQLASDTGLSPAQCRVSLAVFAELKLADFRPEPFQVRLLPWKEKQSLDSSLILRRLRAAAV